MVEFLKGDGAAIMAVFIGAIIAATLIANIGDQVNLATSTFDKVNLTVTVGAVNSSTDLDGREVVGTPLITNGSNADISTQIPVVTGVGTNGLLTVQIQPNDTSVNFVGQLVNLTYTYNPDGYINNSGGRSITLLILIFAALAIVVFVIVMFIKKGSMGELMRSSR